MNDWIAGAARLVTALLIVLLIPVQAIVVPHAAAEVVAEFPEYDWLAIGGIVWAVIAIACVQAVLALLWVLLGIAGRGRIFLGDALRILTAMIWCAAAFTALMILFFVVLNVASAIPPIAALGTIGGALAGFMAVLVFIVLRGLLSTAAATAGELAEVI